MSDRGRNVEKLKHRTILSIRNRRIQAMKVVARTDLCRIWYNPYSELVLVI